MKNSIEQQFIALGSSCEQNEYKRDVLISLALKRISQGKKVCYISLMEHPKKTLEKFVKFNGNPEGLEDLNFLVAEESTIEMEVFKNEILEADPPELIIIERFSSLVGYFERSTEEIIAFLNGFILDGIQIIVSFDLSESASKTLSKLKASFESITNNCRGWIKYLRESSEIAYLKSNSKGNKIRFIHANKNYFLNYSKESGLKF